MKNLLIITALILSGICMLSCNKNSSVQPTKTESVDTAFTNTDTTKTSVEKLGGDDDAPIIMHFVHSVQGDPIRNAVITMSKDGKTFTHKTDFFGSRLFKLPAKGTWHITISRAGYQTYSADVNVQCKFEIKLEMLTAE